MGVLGNVGEGFLADHVKDVRPRLVQGFDMFDFRDELRGDEGVGMELIRQTLHTLHDVLMGQFVRLEVHNVRADVANGGVQRLRGGMNTVRGFLRVLLRGEAGMFKHQPDAVNGLNHAVMQIHADAFAFLKNGDLLFLPHHAQVLNHRRKPARNGGEQGLVRFLLALGEASAENCQPDHAVRSGQRQDHHVIQVRAQQIPFIDNGELFIIQAVDPVFRGAFAQQPLAEFDGFQTQQTEPALVTGVVHQAELIGLLLRVEKELRSLQTQTAGNH